MKKVFLGGTCGTSSWREDLISLLEIDYFNPVVKEWTDTAYQEELKERESCDYCLYVITVALEGVYSIAEVVDDSNKRPEKTIYCYLETGFTPQQLKSLASVGKMVVQNGAHWLKSLEEIALFLNQK